MNSILVNISLRMFIKNKSSTGLLKSNNYIIYNYCCIRFHYVIQISQLYFVKFCHGPTFDFLHFFANFSVVIYCKFNSSLRFRITILNESESSSCCNSQITPTTGNERIGFHITVYPIDLRVQFEHLLKHGFAVALLWFWFTTIANYIPQHKDMVTSIFSYIIQDVITIIVSLKSTSQCLFRLVFLDNR